MRRRRRVSRTVSRLKLCRIAEIWPRRTVWIDNSLRQQVPDLLSVSRHVAAEYVIKRMILADDYDYVLDRCRCSRFVVLEFVVLGVRHADRKCDHGRARRSRRQP